MDGINIPPKLPDNYIFAWQIWIQASGFSSIDSMGGLRNIDKLNEVLDSINITISDIDYYNLRNNVLFINTLINNAKMERNQSKK